MSAPPELNRQEDESQTDAQSIIESASSPTPTIRHSQQQSQIPTAAQTFADILKSQPPNQTGENMSSLAPELKRSNSAQQQEALGKGRPGSSGSNNTTKDEDEQYFRI
ncbi:hypothetical protein I204_04084 [Kwoniella mangroviensis CBS 8886]|nr:hypothetical protein I204_04084 [Kwoniella mangroviensis CBS 8886]